MNEADDGSIVLPKQVISWQKHAENGSALIYDSDAPVTTIPPPELVETSRYIPKKRLKNVSFIETFSNSTPTVYYINGDDTIVEAEVVNKTEFKLPHDWSEPEPDYVKFQLPFNSPHAAKEMV